MVSDRLVAVEKYFDALLGVDGMTDVRFLDYGLQSYRTVLSHFDAKTSKKGRVNWGRARGAVTISQGCAYQMWNFFEDI